MRLPSLSLAAIGLALTMLAPAAVAEPLVGPVKIVVGYAPGGSSDRVARIVGDKLQARLGVPVVVENKTGAGGRVAAQQVRNTPADQNVLMVANPAVMLVAPLVFKDVGYDADSDYVPVSQISDYEFALAVAPGVPVKNLSELIAWLRAHPDTALVTVSLGANDLLGCVDRRRNTADTRCVRRNVAGLRSRLATTLTELRRAAPGARLVVLDYYDPFQAAAVLAPSSRGRGATAGLVRTQVNGAVHGAARDARAQVAWVTAPFDDGWTRRVDLPGHGRVPIRVARICTWTWMCSRRDVHPNDEGYRVIAGAVLTSLTRRR